MPLLPYDPEKAKALLKEAGYPNGLTIKIIHTNLPGMLAMMEVTQAQLRKVGITLDMEVVEHATYHANIRKDMSPIVHYSAARFPVADVYLTQFYHSRSIVGTPTAVTNFSHCNDADAEIDAARVEPDAGQAEGAVEDGAAEADDQGVRDPGLRAAADLGPARVARFRLPAERVAEPRSGRRRGHALHAVIDAHPPSLPGRGRGACG